MSVKLTTKQVSPVKPMGRSRDAERERLAQVRALITPTERYPDGTLKFVKYRVHVCHDDKLECYRLAFIRSRGRIGEHVYTNELSSQFEAIENWMNLNSTQHDSKQTLKQPRKINESSHTRDSEKDTGQPVGPSGAAVGGGSSPTTGTVKPARNNSRR
jgi:hypothetical protein